jgi:hypothetical protein
MTPAITSKSIIMRNSYAMPAIKVSTRRLDELITPMLKNHNGRKKSIGIKNRMRVGKFLGRHKK